MKPEKITLGIQHALHSIEEASNGQTALVVTHALKSAVKLAAVATKGVAIHPVADRVSVSIIDGRIVLMGTDRATLCDAEVGANEVGNNAQVSVMASELAEVVDMQDNNRLTRITVNPESLLIEELKPDGMTAAASVLRGLAWSEFNVAAEALPTVTGDTYTVNVNTKALRSAVVPLMNNLVDDGVMPWKTCIEFTVLSGAIVTKTCDGFVVSSTLCAAGHEGELPDGDLKFLLGGPSPKQLRAFIDVFSDHHVDVTVGNWAVEFSVGANKMILPRMVANFPNVDSFLGLTPDWEIKAKKGELIKLFKQLKATTGSNVATITNNAPVDYDAELDKPFEAYVMAWSSMFAQANGQAHTGDEDSLKPDCLISVGATLEEPTATIEGTMPPGANATVSIGYMVRELDKLAADNDTVVSIGWHQAFEAAVLTGVGSYGATLKGMNFSQKVVPAIKALRKNNWRVTN